MGHIGNGPYVHYVKKDFKGIKLYTEKVRLNYDLEPLVEDIDIMQKTIDANIIAGSVEYMPFRSGKLVADFAKDNIPRIGTGVLKQEGPHIRFLYYGKVMRTPDGRAWAKAGEKKSPTGEYLVYNSGPWGKAWPFWFKRFWADHKKDIIAKAMAAKRKGTPDIPKEDIARIKAAETEARDAYNEELEAAERKRRYRR